MIIVDSIFLIVFIYGALTLKQYWFYAMIIILLLSIIHHLFYIPKLIITDKNIIIQKFRKKNLKFSSIKKIECKNSISGVYYSRMQRITIYANNKKFKIDSNCNLEPIEDVAKEISENVPNYVNVFIVKESILSPLFPKKYPPTIIKVNKK